MFFMFYDSHFVVCHWLVKFVSDDACNCYIILGPLLTPSLPPSCPADS